jgi:hypothetical protein
MARSKKKVILSQHKYVLDLLRDTRMLGCRPINTPIDLNHKLSGGISDQVEKVQYQRLMGKLIFLTHTRPDISYTVSVVSRYMYDPKVSHREVMYQILRYHKGYLEKYVLFSKKNIGGSKSIPMSIRLGGNIDDSQSEALEALMTAAENCFI